jgi:RimJ/RimL family protein N-acetyltransferase
MPGIANPLLLNLPAAFETERLLIRPPGPGDGPAYNAAVRESIEDLRPWMLWAQSVPSVEEHEALLRRKGAEWQLRHDLMLAILRKSDGMLVGSSGLHRIDWVVPRMEIGYWCRTSMTGQGYITEAVLGITAFAFRHFEAQRLEIRVDARNTRSIAVAERAGYTLEARLRHHDRGVDGSLRDTLLYVRFPPETA